MVKNKNVTTKIDTFHTAISHVGFAAMSLATVLSMVGVAEREGHKVTAALQLQPAYSVTDENQNRLQEQGIEELRRAGKEEIRHTSASYGVQMREHYVSGTR